MALLNENARQTIFDLYIYFYRQSPNGVVTWQQRQSGNVCMSLEDTMANHDSIRWNVWTFQKTIRFGRRWPRCSTGEGWQESVHIRVNQIGFYVGTKHQIFVQIVDLLHLS